MTKESGRIMAALLVVLWIIIAGGFIVLFIEPPKKLFKKIAWSLKWKLKRLRYKISRF